MLIYTFAVMHAVSVMVGVLTRSSVATILLVVIFFFMNSCVHNAWETKQVLTDQIADDLGEELEGKELPAVLRYMEDLPYRDIAQRMGLREDTLRKRIHRANQILRKKLKPKKRLRQHYLFPEDT